MTLPMGIVVPMASSLISPPAANWNSPLQYAQAGDWNNFAGAMKYGWLGIAPSGAFDFVNGAAYLKWTIVGGLVHWAAGRLGINRALGRAKVPMLRV